MEAVQESIDTLASLEERITRAVQAISTLRTENSRLEEQLKAAQERSGTATSELQQAQSLAEEFHKENSELEQKVAQMQQEIDTMKGERKQVKTRIEKLLNQLDLLSAS